MKVILAKTQEIKDVAFGYAVNYLIPKGLAIVATPKEIEKLEQKQKDISQHQQLREKEDQVLAKKLKNKKVIIEAKSSKEKKLFGSVGKNDILKALEVDRSRVEVVLPKPIRTLGKFEVELKIGNSRINISVEVKKKNES